MNLCTHCKLFFLSYVQKIAHLRPPKTYSKGLARDDRYLSYIISSKTMVGLEVKAITVHTQLYSKIYTYRSNPF